MLQFRCGNCGQNIGVPEAYAGKRVRCPRCKEPARVRREVEPVPAAPEAPLPQSIVEKVEGDFASVFVNGPPTSVEGSQRPPIPDHFSASEREVIDPPQRPAETAPDSAQEVAALLRGLSPEQQSGVFESEPRPPTDSGRSPSSENSHEDPPSTTSFAIALAALSLLLAVAAIAVCWQPKFVRFALPVAAAGAGLGIVAIVTALIARGSGLVSAVASTLASCLAAAFIFLGMRGLLPPRFVPSTLAAASGSVIAGNEPDSSNPAHDNAASAPARLGDVEVRVASALVLRPSVDDGDLNTLHTAPTRYLQVTLELRNVGDSHPIEYRTWGKPAAEGAFASLMDARGDSLKLIDLSPLMPIGRVKDAATLYSRGPAVSDVLLFEPPVSSSAELTLELPGNNAGAPGQTFRLRIPADSIRSQ